MEIFDDRHEDAQLRGLLREWQAPDPPAELEARVTRARRGTGWRFFVTGYVRVPVAAVYVFGILVTAGVWKLAAHEPVAPCMAEARGAAQAVKDSLCGHGVRGFC
ncbi:MAG TPA: hypothetical protein VGL72_29475 [Bryobacteraceae bacterium]|jgi:hypothetical protein